MELFTLLGIALGLSMDALAVSVTNGFIIKELKFKHAFRIALAFGFFQAIMPIIGWAAGSFFAEYIKGFDHWIAFVLLVYIGGKMLFESFKKEEESCSDEKNCTHLPTLIIMSIATSIDALAVGLSFAFLNVSIAVPVLVIGGITFVLCLAGVYIGNKVGHFFENKLELVGGLVLIGIGVKILIEHLFFISSV